MSLSEALSSALAGLRANQAALALVSSNVSNSQTPGYTRKTINQVETVNGSSSIGVLVTGVNRELDKYLQAQVLTEKSGAAYANTRASFLSNLQSIYGNPGSTGTLEAALSGFTTAMQALSTSPDSVSARTDAVNAAQRLTVALNTTTDGIQALRASAETGINDSVQVANNAMSQIANINKQLKLLPSTTGAEAAALLDQRDLYISQLSELMDVRVIDNGDNSVSVFTGSGTQLVGDQAAKLSFNPQGTVTPNTQWSADPSQSAMGSLTVTFPSGGTMDLTAPGAIRSGKLAAYLELRDKTLVQAQAQVDQLAASLASGMSDQTTSGTAATAGAQTGFDLDLAGMKTGNIVHLSYTDTVTGTTHNVSIVRVDDPSVLPLSDTATADTGDKVIGIDFSGGLASVVTQLNAALGSANLQFSNPAGSTLRVLDDGAAGLSDVNSASVTKTVSSLTGSTQLPLFMDGGSLYTGATTASGAQQTGLAGRITVNTAVLASPSTLVAYDASTPSGDTTRVDFILNQLTTAKYTFDPATGVGSKNAPLTGTLLSFTQQFLGLQGSAASAAQQLADGQNVVLSTLEGKMADGSGVNIDEEMAKLLALQNAYSANARVMSAVKDMYDLLMRSM